MAIRLIIVDDHAIVRQGLRALLDVQPQISVVGEAADGEMALTLIHSLKPDVVLLDLLMPDMSGITVLERLGQEGLAVHVLVLTSSIDEHLIIQALQAGALGYLLKTSRGTEVIEAVERVASGTPVLDAVATQAMLQQTRTVDPLDELTTREREVFELLARGWNIAEIAEQLSVSHATVRTHTASILDKLSLRDRVQVMAFALKHGFVKLDELH